jgi:hypothetical protein
LQTPAGRQPIDATRIAVVLIAEYPPAVASVEHTIDAVPPAPAPVSVWAPVPAPKSVATTSFSTPSISSLQVRFWASAPVLLATNFAVTTQLPPPGSARLSMIWAALAWMPGPVAVAL